MGLSDRLRRKLSRRLDYRDCFLNPAGELTDAGRSVMKDLARFCGPYRSSLKVSPVTRTVDPIATAAQEGRREVYLRILAILSVTETDILKENESE